MEGLAETPQLMLVTYACNLSDISLFMLVIYQIFHSKQNHPGSEIPTSLCPILLHFIHQTLKIIFPFFL